MGLLGILIFYLRRWAISVQQFFGSGGSMYMCLRGQASFSAVRGLLLFAAGCRCVFRAVSFRRRFFSACKEANEGVAPACHAQASAKLEAVSLLLLGEAL